MKTPLCVRKATQALGQIKQDKAAHILPHLLALIPSELGEEAFYAISGIQQNCQFYNYEIFRKQLPPVVSPQQSTDDSMLKALQQINQGVQKMSETPNKISPAQSSTETISTLLLTTVPKMCNI
jgi:hypothetical protein